MYIFPSGALYLWAGSEGLNGSCIGVKSVFWFVPFSEECFWREGLGDGHI